MQIEKKLESMGLILPNPLSVPSYSQLSFVWVRLRDSRAYISGHIPQNADGSIAEPRGKVGREVSLKEAHEAARLTALSMLASLKRELGDLDRVVAWLKVRGMVNSAADFTQQSFVMSGFSDLIVELFGADAGQHALSAIAVTELPFDVPVEVEAEVEVNAGSL